MLGVLAIIGVLSVAGISGYSKAMAKFKVTKTIDQVSMIVANIRTIYAGQRNYKGLDTKTSIGIGAIPSEMLGGAADTITNAFNGLVDIKAVSSGGVADLAFYVNYKGLSQDACATLATSDWGSGSQSGLLAMAIADAAAAVPTATNENSGVFIYSALPITPVQAATKCANGSSLTWYYF
ncbi:MAG: hypothetical protein LBR70_00185 [Lactobacillaceae bacterium]|nr:hypothetical protein [Lactobacillaceae bacterium]